MLVSQLVEQLGMGWEELGGVPLGVGCKVLNVSSFSPSPPPASCLWVSSQLLLYVAMPDCLPTITLPTMTVMDFNILEPRVPTK